MLDIEPYTVRVLQGFVSKHPRKPKPFCMMLDGRFLRGWADGSKSRNGVRYNRLARLWNKQLHS